MTTKRGAATIQEYLDSIPEERRKAIRALRALIRKKLPKGYEETMQWGMISYQVPLRVYPDTYNKQPLVYAALASQKNHMAVYLCGAYVSPAGRKKLESGFRAAGKKLDMGASCVRFKRLDDLALDAIGEAIASTPVDQFVAVAKASRKEKA